MAVLVTIELFTLYFAVTTLSAVRSFVAGEGMWSKAEKDAAAALNQYARSHNEADYGAFKQYLKVPLGDRNARLALLTPHPDLEKARQGLLDGRNHPDDIDGMISLVLRFHKVYYINKAFTLWANAEPVIGQLTKISEDLHFKINNGASQKDIDKSLENIKLINKQLTDMEDGFSYTLGEGARWLENLVLKILLTLSVTIGTTSILITISVSNGIEKGLKAIINGAKLISKGNLTSRVKVYSQDEIGLLADAFNQMTDKLEQNSLKIIRQEESLRLEKERVLASEKVKQLFLMNMSHEIRTPINVVLGFAHLLEDSLIDEEQLEYISMLIKAGNELLVILNDILEFSKIESGDIVVETYPFNLNEMIYAILADIEPQAIEKNIHLNCSVDNKVPGIIWGDKGRVNQILMKLLSNAIKFTERGEVVIDVCCIADYPEYVELEFSIKDTGIGIPVEKQEKIFDYFEQGSVGTGRKFGGTGLGLSIVKQLVKLLDGNIYVNSTPGKGSEFYFRLAFLKYNHQTGQRGPVILNAVNKEEQLIALKPKVLIVDDNPMNRMLVVKILQKRGFETGTAENGKIAVFKVRNQNYDIVLMDLQMPEMDGYEATRQIRAWQNDKKNIPIIAMTAHTMPGDMEKCFEIGMDDFIPKPFFSDMLFEKIYALLLLSKN
ncbi:response regulator [Mucilaginibacter sp. X5P1]|uniref:response regulator n=1 Tax=Mucilaginibacter sp. X5P1 TaxID=2723088 RepID=UPI003B0088C5